MSYQQENQYEDVKHRRSQNLDDSDIVKYLQPATKYFMIKCGNYENIKISQEHS